MFQKLVLSHIDSDTVILCSHGEDVNKYNDLIIHKMFHVNEFFYVMMETNAMGVEHVENWFYDSKFANIKYVAIGAKVMITTKHKYFKRSYEWNSCYSNIYYID
jgi:hypothetical protein